MNTVDLHYPWNRKAFEALCSGEQVRLTGILYMARDAAHANLVEDFKKTGAFRFDIRNQGIYYAGPAPAKPGSVIGPAGPTTSGRMDKFTPMLLDNGLLFMIGKGDRNKEATDAIIRNKCVYLAAVGGVAAIISKCIKSQEIIAYPELGPEALRKLYVEDFPAIVIIDSNGNNLYETGRRKYRKT